MLWQSNTLDRYFHANHGRPRIYKANSRVWKNTGNHIPCHDCCLDWCCASRYSTRCDWVWYGFIPHQTHTAEQPSASNPRHNAADPCTLAREVINDSTSTNMPEICALGCKNSIHLRPTTLPRPSKLLLSTHHAQPAFSIFVHITIYAVKYNSPIDHSQYFFCHRNELFLLVDFH